MKHTQNEAFMNKDGVIEIVYRGDQDLRTINTLIDAIVAIHHGQKRQVDYLIDLGDIGKVSPSLMWTVISRLKNLHIGRQAVFGGNEFIRFLVNDTLGAIGKMYKIRHFETREQAEAWLSLTVLKHRGQKSA
jgi:hypothetical protein